MKLFSLGVNKIFWFQIILFFFYPFFVSAQNFDQVIYLPAQVSKPVSEAVQDLAYWLEKATGKHFEIKQNEAVAVRGIIIGLISDLKLPAADKEKISVNGQSFYLSINGNTSATIAGSGDNSLVNGIYTFLHELGFRWYMPGDTWTIVPKKIPKQIQINKFYSPDFQGRFYAGTGGVNAIAGTDPQNNFKKDYNLWNRRNRFGTDYAIKGHSGHIFYNANKTILDAHPEWFCNKKISRFGRMDISHPEVVRLFTNWALSQIKPGDAFPTIGVDPSDGAGGKDDCLPANMPQIKTWSDKYFWLANQVAKQLDSKNAKTQVQLYAYSNHAAPPSFELQRSVYPIIIPYAFQRITSPAEFIKLWNNKISGRPMGIYDYWNITQWSSGTPQFNIYSIPEKLKLWQQYNITSINLETTNGKGAMGHALWLASQMMWETSLSFDDLYQEFLNNCFGPAATDIKRMYDRWSKNFQQEMEVDLSMQNLASATSKTKDKTILARLNELKAFVHYLKLYYEYQAAPKSVEAYENLTSYIHTIHHLRLVQSSALLANYIKAPSGYKNKNIIRPALSANQIEAQFKSNLRNAVTYSISDFNFNIKKARPLPKEPVSTARFINGRNNYQFFLPEARDFQIKVGANKDTRLLITDKENKTVYEKVIPGKEGFFEVQVHLPAGVYNLSFGDFSRFSKLIFPTDLVLISSGISYYDNANYPYHYVYIPKEADAIVYEDKLGPSTNKRGYWLDPVGSKVEPIKLRTNIYHIPVPPQFRGSVWTFVIGHRNFKLLNIPNRFSIRKFDYKENN